MDVTGNGPSPAWRGGEGHGELAVVATQAALPASVPASVPAGWYADPQRRWRWRYWSGTEWTEAVSNGGTVTREPLPQPEVDARMRLPVRALWWAVGGIVGGEVLGGLLAWAADSLSGHRFLAELLAGQAGLWAGFAAAVIIASHRYGTGNIRVDYAVRARKNDIWLGMGFSLLCRIAGIIVLIPVVVAFRHYFDHAPSSEGVFNVDKSDKGALIALALIASVGAPFIEELLFRGLIMGSMRRLGRWWALGLQAILFASVHMRVSYGRANILTFGAILMGGLGLGWCAQHYKRLGVGMWTHAFFNLLVVAILLATTL